MSDPTNDRKPNRREDDLTAIKVRKLGQQKEVANEFNQILTCQVRKRDRAKIILQLNILQHRYRRKCTVYFCVVFVNTNQENDMLILIASCVESVINIIHGGLWCRSTIFFGGHSACCIAVAAIETIRVVLRGGEVRRL